MPGASDPWNPGQVSFPPAPEVAPAVGAPGPGPVPRPCSPWLTPDGVPRLFRRRDLGVAGGVAAGIAEHLRVEVFWVRVAFALLAAMGGAGVVGYAVLWVVVRPRPEVPPPVGLSASRSGRPAAERRQAIGIAAVGLALVVAAGRIGFTHQIGWVLGPLGLAALGAGFVWREADGARRARWRRTAQGFVGEARSSLWRLAGGSALVVGGLAVFALGKLDLSAVRSALLAVLLTLIGVAVITVPWWVRLVRDLGSERSARTAERERAEVAAHLHDSVLQTLALIQRQPDNAREVLRLARSQERQLRTWLYGPTGYAWAGTGRDTDPLTFAVALAAAAGEVEDTYTVAVAPVVVGDAALDPHLHALIAAAREAMVNAAKHAGVPEISVYAELGAGRAEVFVRDRGSGFDPAAVAADRRGLAQSVRGRMQRHGGQAVVRSQPGQGTEVELTMPIDGGRPAQESTTNRTATR